MDFGRQPKPVTVTIEGDEQDVAYWRRELTRIRIRNPKPHTRIRVYLRPKLMAKLVSAAAADRMSLSRKARELVLSQI